MTASTVPQIATPNLLRDFRAYCLKRNLEAPTEALRVMYANALALMRGAIGFFVPAKAPYRLVMEVTRDCDVDLRTMHLPFPKVALEQVGSFDDSHVYTQAGATRVTIDGVITFCDEEENGFLSYRALRVKEAEGHRWIAPYVLFFAPRDYVLFSSETIIARYEMSTHKAVPHELLEQIPDKQCGHMATEQIGLLAQFVSLCSCENVTPVKVREPSAHMQAAAKKRGNLPHDDYWTLDVFLPSKDEGDEDAHGFSGPHTSPRLHFRRGHIRRLPSGRNTWVRHCMVGRAELGKIEKDYRLNI